MNEHQFEQAQSIMYDIGIREHHINEINGQIKSFKEMTEKNCECYIKTLGSNRDTQFFLYPLSKKIAEAIIEQLNDRKEEYKKEIKQLKEKLRKI